jgi:hypothetical protein
MCSKVKQDINVNAVKYPVWGHDEKFAWALMNLKPLEVAEGNYVSDNRANDLKFIDSDLNFFQVDGIKVLGRAGIFGWRPGYTGTYFNIELKLKFVRQLNFEEAKSYITRFVSNHPAIYSSSESFEEFETRVNNAKNMHSLILDLM